LLLTFAIQGSGTASTSFPSGMATTAGMSLTGAAIAQVNSTLPDSRASNTLLPADDGTTRRRRGIAASRAACVRPGSVYNRLYQRRDGTLARWRAADVTQQTLARLPAHAAPGPEGLFVRGNELFVEWKVQGSTRAARVVADGAGYRIELNDGVAGPFVERQGDGTWELSFNERNYAKGSVVAHVLSEDVTTNAAVINRAAAVMEQLGLPESRLASMFGAEASRAEIAPLVGLAAGHAIIETLPARLRDPAATAWTARELGMVVAAMAMQTGRPLAFYRQDGHLELSVGPDGRQIAASDPVPDTALRLRRIGERYVRVDDTGPGTPRDYRSVFAAVEEATRPPDDLRVREPAVFEAEFRGKLADALETRSRRPEVERLHRLLPMPDGQRRIIEDVSRLRQALFDKHHSLTAAEEFRLLTAVRDLMPADRKVAIEVRRHGSTERLALFDTEPPARDRIVIEADIDAGGRRTAYYRQDNHGESIRSRFVDEPFSPIVDVLLNAGNGELRTALSRGEWDWRLFANDILTRIVDDENALLSPGLEHLVRHDPGIVAHALGQAADQWFMDGHHYVRLRNLYGRTQVVETSPIARDGAYEILTSQDGVSHGSGSFLRQRDGKWYPVRGIQVSAIRRTWRTRSPVDTAIRFVSGAAKKAACVRPASLSNRLYRRRDGTLSRWTAANALTHTVPQLPLDATPRPDGMFGRGGDLLVYLQVGDNIRTANVFPDGAGYRIRLEGNIDGPLIERQQNNLWGLASHQDNDVKGSVLARFIPETITADARTLNHAADVMEQMGLSETRLLELSASPRTLGNAAGGDLANLAVGQAFLETLPDRLRDPSASTWTTWEVQQIAPAMAAQTGRPLAFYRQDGSLGFAVQPDGTTVAADAIPDTALHLQRIDERYILLDGHQGDTPRDHRSIFAAVERGTRPAGDLRVMEADLWDVIFRAKLADAFEARSTFPELNRMQQGLIDINGRNHSRGHVKRLMDMSRMQHALFDRHHALTALEERRLLMAVQDIMPVDRKIAIEVRQNRTGEQLAFLGTTRFTVPTRSRIVIEAETDAMGRRIAYYRQDSHGEAIRSRPVEESFSPIIDVLLNAGNGELRNALSRGEWDWRLFANDVLARLVEKENVLLPPGSDHLVVNDPGLLAQAETQATDRWIANGRQYVTLRNLDGRTQVVETSNLQNTDGTYHILHPLYSSHYASTWRVIERDGKWFSL
jgi:antitoxin component of RelBE/YafQ-DinJ toxin-antitoxin module